MSNRLNLKSLKYPIALFGLILVGGLSSRIQPLLASDANIPINNQNSNLAYNSVVAPIRLEIRLSQRRVTVYQGAKPVKSYPVAIGRQGWETPTGNFEIKDMRVNPKWISPVTGKSIPGGSPRNPMRRHWIGFWTNGKSWIGFHGTLHPSSIGKAASDGCLRMYDRDLQDLFSTVKMGTPVSVRP